MSHYLGTELFMFDDAIVLLSQHQDSPVVVQNHTELYVLLTFWGFEESEIKTSIDYLMKEKHNHINFGMNNTMIFTSNKSDEEFEDMVMDYAQRRLVS